MTTADTTPTTTARPMAAHWRAVCIRHPDAIAISTPEASITYAEAAQRVARDAAAITAHVDTTQQPVAVDIESDIDSVIAMLAVIISGHPLVPLDPFLPPERRAAILRLSGASAYSPADIAALATSTEPIADTAGTDPAVLIFTSGSTGRPKGVMLSQQMPGNHAVDGRRFLNLGPGERAAVLLPLSFGGGLDAMSMTLLNGATMMLWDTRRRGSAGLREWLAVANATTVHSTPSLLRSWLGDNAGGDEISSIRLVSTCGEPAHHTDVALVRDNLHSSAAFCVWAGASEVGNLAFNVIPPQQETPAGPLPAGSPASDKQIRILGDDGQDAQIGTVGEVIVESAHMALGYHNDPSMTRQRFDPLDDGRVRYRTGDLGRIDGCGRLQLIGRSDDAIKIRGYLVEPMEVESAIRALHWATDAVVTADRAAARLVAHVAVNSHAFSPSPAEIRKELSKMLASWMVPQEIVVVETIPRTERGKVDRAALPPPPPRGTPESPRGLTERGLQVLWRQILELDTIGRHDDFISLGGDSLAAATMVTEVREHLHVEVTTAMLAEAPTIAEFAKVIDAAGRARSRKATGATLVQLRQGVGRPLFLVSGAGSLGASMAPLARTIDTDRPVFAIQSRGIEKRARADRSIRQAAARAVADIRSVQPHGPYDIAGYSLGGFIAVEVAAQLARAGESVAEVVVLDSIIGPVLAKRLQRKHSRVALHRLSAPVATTQDVLPERTGQINAPPPMPLPARIAQQATLRALVHVSGLVQLPTALQWVVFFNLGTRMIQRHRPSPFTGPIHVLRSRTNTDDGTLWQRFTTGAVRFSDIEAEHTSVIRVPHTATAARVIESSLITPAHS